MFDGYEGVQRLFNLIIIYYSLASVIHTVKYLKNPNHFQVQRVIHTIPGSHESVFPCLFCLKLHDYTILRYDSYPMNQEKKTLIPYLNSDYLLKIMT